MITTKNLVFWGLGALTGAVTGYLISELIVEKVEEAGYEDCDLPIGKIISIDGDSFEGISTPAMGDLLERMEKADKVDYTKFSKPPLQDVVEKYDEENLIRIVNESRNHYDVEEVIYYDKDNVFASEVGDVVFETPETTFGPNIHLHFGEGCVDQNVVNVWNENAGVIYRITRVSGSYREIVLGEPEEPVKKSRVKRKYGPGHEVAEKSAKIMDEMED